MSLTQRRRLISLCLVFSLLLGCYSLKRAYFSARRAANQAPAVLISASVTQAPLKIRKLAISAKGKLNTLKGIELSSETPGVVKEIRFSNGQLVRRGAVLIRLDTALEEAQLKSMQTKLKLAQLIYLRSQKLLENKRASQTQFENSLAELQQAQVDLETIQTRIKQKTITAPFDSKAGNCQVSLGQTIYQGTTLVVLQSLNPLFVRYNLPEQTVSDLHLAQLLKTMLN